MDAKNRRALLLNESSQLNGIDFVEVAATAQTTLRVHFINTLPLAGAISVTIEGGERIPKVAIGTIDATEWTKPVVGAHRIVTITVVAPGEFSNYTLTLRSDDANSGLDPYFSTSVFSFKAGCPSDLDCVAAAVDCPVPPADAPPIDYLAKDFLSFRQALLDFSALRYPEWQERSEADFGGMFMEALCAQADDLSQTQDRIAAECALETATQRRSVVRLARLVDYEPRPATAARVLLQFDVAPGVTAIPAGTVVSARGPDGATIPFETGGSLTARLNSTTKLPALLAVDSRFNSGILPYWFDDSQRCLRAGAKEMFVRGQGFGFKQNQLLLIETKPASSADPTIRQIVRLAKDGEEICDPLFSPQSDLTPLPPVIACGKCKTGTAVTRITWSDADKLQVDLDLTQAKLAGNLIEATQGATQPAETFVIPPPSASLRNLERALVRTGPNNTFQYLHSLRVPGLAWLAQDDPAQLPQPEVTLTATAPGGAPTAWTFFQTLLNAQPLQEAFTVDPARYARVAGNTVDSYHFDYDGDAGETLRFGDGVFGAKPVHGTLFTATYRVGGGAVGNVAAGSITQIDPKVAGVMRVSNPLAATGGADAEPLDRVRRLAPQAFRAVQFRAVLPQDYADAAQTLPWVQRAGAAFRWTGSWLTAFTTPDPLHSEQIAIENRIQLINLLNRYRMAGCESYVPDPKYVSLDLAIEACAKPDVFRGDVEDALLKALGSGPNGFFNPDNFTFGQSLQLSALEAAIQRVYGIAGILGVRYRIRGRTDGFTGLPDTLTVGVDEILRCDNDASVPEHGSLKVNIQGGK